MNQTTIPQSLHPTLAEMEDVCLARLDKAVRLFPVGLPSANPLDLPSYALVVVLYGGREALKRAPAITWVEELPMHERSYAPIPPAKDRFIERIVAAAQL